MTATTPWLGDNSCFSSNRFIFCHSYEMCLNSNSMTWLHTHTHTSHWSWGGGGICWESWYL